MMMSKCNTPTTSLVNVVKNISTSTKIFILFQDRLSSLPPAPRTPVSDFQHPYFPPPFASTGPLAGMQHNTAGSAADVFTPVSLQHLQTADPYQVTTTTLHSFSPNQVSSQYCLIHFYKRVCISPFFLFLCFDAVILVNVSDFYDS